jgi:two-component system NtrC family response regulator
MKKPIPEEDRKPDSAGLPKLLAVDDDEQILRQIHWALGDKYRVYTASDRETALRIFREEEIPVVLLDLGLPPLPREAAEGLATLEELVAGNPLVKVIIVSGNAERQAAFLAVEKGAHDIFPKPIDLEELRVVLHRVFRRHTLEKEQIEERQACNRMTLEEIVGSSDAMKAVYSTLHKVAKTEVPVLIMGESGTGKELIANAIHNLGPRRSGPFTAINCSAIPETLLESELFGHEKGSFTGATSQRLGRLEYAQGGTLFLDEIGDLAPAIQVKLLRFLQEKVIERIGGRDTIQVDSRVIAATNQDLDTAVRENRFREDLYFRLAVVKIRVPPLRERGDDIMELAEHLLDSFSKELKRPPKRLSRSAVEAMKRHDWPGNVRELQNRLKRALVLADGSFVGPCELELEDARGSTAGGIPTLREAREVLERKVIIRALQENGGNISRTARVLGISRPTLYELMSKYGL